MTHNVGKTDKIPKELTGRCRIFLELWIIQGYKIARELSGYSNRQIERILKDERAKAFMSEKFKEIAARQGWTQEQELLDLKKMIKDPSIPGSSRIAAQERFVDRFEDNKEIEIFGSRIAEYSTHSLTKPKEKHLLEPVRTVEPIIDDDSGEVGEGKGDEEDAAALVVDT